ncbi:hypothetical protein JKA74_01265 [Marivirga sp. S37H4]|uniref:Secreted protein n=1 Tax=Marivirga aurantiaca TaxID=2802615 RepID=A0A934WVE3_9BACT|nr:hypothetical protein [Marivirga aurantiaca]MBK6263647.1 hypothetical protein [Marivirga aurantiaca]
MKKCVIFIGLLGLLFTTKAYSQDYTRSIGLRGGYPTALTGKFFTSQNVALEGMLTGYRGGFEFTGLYEMHKNAFDVPYLNWYYGPGFHIGAFDDRYDNYYYNNRGDGFVVGFDFILGLEYTLTDIPFVIGIDFKPGLDIVPNFRGNFGAGVSLRFYF